MRGNSVNDSKSRLKLITISTKKAQRKRAYSINDEMLKTYVPDIPEPIEELKKKGIRSQRNVRSIQAETEFSPTSEIWLG